LDHGRRGRARFLSASRAVTQSGRYPRAPAIVNLAAPGTAARGPLAYNPRVAMTSDALGSAAPQRPPADRCPGVLRLTEAADGHLARVRLPGGLVTAAQLRTLARLAGAMGDGRVELTSRGNVQLRALPAGAVAAINGKLAAVGMLPPR
jgi:sulfite reductase beta subunit-like hemoprotein